MGTNFYLKRDENGRRLIDGQVAMVVDTHYDGSPLHKVNMQDLGNPDTMAAYLAAYKEAQKNGPLVVASINHPMYHLGKRSSAGGYCWDCKVTLDSSDHCPKCHRPREYDKFNATMVEERLSQSSINTKTGVTSCCSFSWAMNYDVLYASCLQFIQDEKVIEDGYGEEFTPREFQDMLDKLCPIQLTHSIGSEFS